MTTRPELSEEIVERVNRIAGEGASASVETLSYEERMNLVLDEYKELRREVEELRKEVERLRRQRGGVGEDLHDRREEAERLREEQADPTKGKDTFEF